MILLGLSRAGKTSIGRLLAERLCCPFYDTDELIRIRTGLTPRQLYRQSGVSALHAAEAAALRECCGRAPFVSTDNRHDTTAETGRVASIPIESRHGTTLAESGTVTADPTEHRCATVSSVENLCVTAAHAETGAVIAAGGGICDNTEAYAIVAAIPLRVFLYAEEATLFKRLTYDALQTGYYPAFLHFLSVAQQTEAQQLFTELYARRTKWYRSICNLIIDTTGLDCAAAAQKIAEYTAQ